MRSINSNSDKYPIKTEPGVVWDIGLSVDAIKAAGSTVLLKDGCRDTLQLANQLGIPIHVVSVNWSSSLVAAALGLPARVARR